MGGCSDLMDGMAKLMSDKGFDAITFDLRGAGKSNGNCTFTNKSELRDAIAMVKHIIENNDNDVVLVGSSGGAPLAGAVLDYSPRVLGGVFIGYVWGFWASILFGWAYASIQQSCKPKLFVVGTHDEFTSMAQYDSRIKGLSGDCNTMKVIKGKNHFQIEAPCYDHLVSTYILELIESCNK